MTRADARKQFRIWDTLTAEEKTRSGVYLLHFRPAFKAARHYLGFAENLERRTGEHIAGKSRVKIIDGAHRHGCGIERVAAILGATVQDEKEIKGGRNEKRVGSLARICPLCRGSAQ